MRTQVQGSHASPRSAEKATQLSGEAVPPPGTASRGNDIRVSDQAPPRGTQIKAPPLFSLRGTIFFATAVFAVSFWITVGLIALS